MKRKEAIKRTREGVIQVFNDYHPSTKEIKKFLKEAFPDDEMEENNTYILNEFFRKDSVCYGLWFSSNNNFNLPVINLSTITKRKKGKLSQLEKQFSELAKDVVELRQTIAKDVEVDVKEVKSKLIVGEWYKNEKYGYIFCFNGKYKDFSQYGISINNEWKTGISSHKRHMNFIIKATPKEVQTSLENEAKKRGFKEGVKIHREFDKDLKDCKINTYEYFFDKEWYYDFKNDYLEHHGFVVYSKGQWAEIIQQETIKEEEIDFSVQDLFIYEGGTYVVCSNGKQNLDENTFEGKVIYSTGMHQPVNYYSKSWVKDCFKTFKGELTIK